MDPALEHSEFVNKIWVQCENDSCLKWRLLSPEAAARVEHSEPWYCFMNSDSSYNSCSVSEEDFPAESQFLDSGYKIVYSQLPLGSLVLVKLQNWPSWPGILCPDPFKGKYVTYDQDGNVEKYHIEFLGDPHSTAWISATFVGHYSLTLKVAECTNKKKRWYRSALEEAYQLYRHSPEQRLEVCCLSRQDRAKAGTKAPVVARKKAKYESVPALPTVLPPPLLPFHGEDCSLGSGCASMLQSPFAGLTRSVSRTTRFQEVSLETVSSANIIYLFQHPLLKWPMILERNCTKQEMFAAGMDFSQNLEPETQVSKNKAEKKKPKVRKKKRNATLKCSVENICSDEALSKENMVVSETEGLLKELEKMLQQAQETTAGADDPGQGQLSLCSLEAPAGSPLHSCHEEDCLVTDGTGLKAEECIEIITNSLKRIDALISEF